MAGLTADATFFLYAQTWAGFCSEMEINSFLCPISDWFGQRAFYAMKIALGVGIAGLGGHFMGHPRRWVRRASFASMAGLAIAFSWIGLHWLAIPFDWDIRGIQVTESPVSFGGNMFDEILAEAKRTANPLAVIQLEDNPELRRLLAAWHCIPVGRREPAVPGGLAAEGGPGPRWNWLWTCATVEPRDIMIATGIEEPMPVFDLAVANRLIYPDGTIHEQARDWLIAKAMKPIAPRG